MTTGAAILVLTAFLASAVEAVEALTAVLAVGVTRGWRSSLIGAGTATLALGAVIATLGPALSLMPIDILRVIVGTLLLVIGLQWLRKAILRAGRYNTKLRFIIRNFIMALDTPQTHSRCFVFEAKDGKGQQSSTPSHRRRNRRPNHEIARTVADHPLAGGSPRFG
jgi:hypothetical protein